MSLLPAFAGLGLTRDFLAWEHEGHRAIRAGDWKLVGKSRGPWELYDLGADRTELHDRAAKEPERVKALAEQWDRWAERCRVVPKPERTKG